MRATWAEDRDQSDPAVPADICQQVGLDGIDLIDAAPNRSAPSTEAIPLGRLRPACSDHRSTCLPANDFGDRIEMLEEAIVRSAADDLGRTMEAMAGKSL